MFRENGSDKPSSHGAPGRNLVSALSKLGFNQDSKEPTQEDIESCLDTVELRQKLTEPEVRALEQAFDVSDDVFPASPGPSTQAVVHDIESGVIARARAAGVVQLPRAEHERRRGIRSRSEMESK